MAYSWDDFKKTRTAGNNDPVKIVMGPVKSSGTVSYRPDKNTMTNAVQTVIQLRNPQNKPGLNTAQAGITTGITAIHQRMQQQIAQAQQAQLEQSRTSFMFRERPAQAVPASLSPIQRLKSALVLPDMSESERLRRQLEAMENKVNANKTVYNEARGALSSARLRATGRTGGIGAGGGNQFMAREEAGAALTESKKAYNDLLDKYNAALAREKQEEMSAYSAQEMGAKLDELKAQRDAAKAELQEATQAARTTPYTIYNPEAKKAALDRASQAKDKLDALEQEYNTWLNQYYVRENEEKRAAISQDAAMSGQYATARKLQEDLEKVSAVMKGSGGSLKRQETIEEYKVYLAVQNLYFNSVDWSVPPLQSLSVKTDS